MEKLLTLLRLPQAMEIALALLTRVRRSLLKVREMGPEAMEWAKATPMAVVALPLMVLLLALLMGMALTAVLVWLVEMAVQRLLEPMASLLP